MTTRMCTQESTLEDCRYETSSLLAHVCVLHIASFGERELEESNSGAVVDTT